MDGTSNYYGILCDSGHKAALGIQLHMTNVWMESRPTPDEFKEVVQKARAALSTDELWDNILEEMYQNDREERFCYAARKVRGIESPVRNAVQKMKSSGRGSHLHRKIPGAAGTEATNAISAALRCRNMTGKRILTRQHSRKRKRREKRAGRRWLLTRSVS